MTSHEQDNAHETVGRQFIDYVTAHSDVVAPEQQAEPGLIRQAYWTLHVDLPLLHDSIAEVSFLERELTLADGQGFRGSPEDYEAEKKPTYDIGIHLSSGLNAYYTYRPNNSRLPYEYLSTVDSGEPIQETGAANLIAELEAYETIGIMTKIPPEAN